MLARSAIVMAVALGRAPAFELSWEAPEGCPTGGEVRARVEALLPEPSRTAELRAVARARENPEGRWTVALRLESAQGVAERELSDASSCRAAADAAAVVVAIAIDPELALDGVPEPPPTAEPSMPAPSVTAAKPVASAPPRSTPAAIAPSVDEPPTPPPKQRPRPRGAIAIAPAISFGTLPGAAGVARLWGAVLWPRVRAGIGAAFTGAAPLRTAGAEISLLRWTVDAYACPVFAVGRRVEIVPCVGIEAGQTVATSRGLVDPRDPRDPWVAAFVQPAVAVLATRRFAVLAGGQLVVPVLRRRYVVDGPGEVFTTAPVGGGAVVALELRIP